MELKIVWSEESVDAMIEALKGFAEIAKDYPDDPRFQQVTDEILAAIGHDGKKRADAAGG